MSVKTWYLKTCGTQKGVLKGKFTAIKSHLRKWEKAQVNNLTLHLKQLQKEEQTTLEISRKKEILKIGAEINEIEMKKKIANINETRSFFLK